MPFHRVMIAAAAGLLLASCAGGKSMDSLDDNTKAFVQAASTWDKDRDGIVTCDEWKAYAARLHQGADASGDGFLDAKEYQSLGGRDALFISVKMEYFDANKDNRVSKEELAGRNPAFATLDQNNDCGLTMGEFAAGPQERKKTIGREDLMKDRSVR